MESSEVGASVPSIVATNDHARLYDTYRSTHVGEVPSDSGTKVLSRDLLPQIPDPGVHGLDLGCGAGELLGFLQDHGCRNLTGIDISDEQVELAHDQGRHYVRKADVFEFLSTTTDKFGLVTAFDFLEHVPKGRLPQVLSDVYRVLRPGGVFVVRVPNGAGPLAGRIQYGDYTHETCLTAGSLRQMSKSSGFGTARFKEVPPAVYGFRSAARRVVWSTSASFFRAMAAAETGALRGHILTSNLMGYFTKARL